MIWTCIYLACQLIATIVISVIEFKKVMREDMLSFDMFLDITLLASLKAIIWPFFVVVAIVYGFLKLLQGKRGES